MDKRTNKDRAGGSVTAYIGLGSNLSDPIRQIKTARRACAVLEGVRELAFSSLYRSPPMGPQDQPHYVNAVMAIATDLPAIDLLHALQSIESDHGRIRTGQRWGARTLDLDLLLYGNEVINSPRLTVPHPGITGRSFVLYPLYEIAPDIVIPGKGRISDLIVHCPLHGLQRIE